MGMLVSVCICICVHIRSCKCVGMFTCVCADVPTGSRKCVSVDVVCLCLQSCIKSVFCTAPHCLQAHPAFCNASRPPTSRPTHIPNLCNPLKQNINPVEISTAEQGYYSSATTKQGSNPGTNYFNPGGELPGPHPEADLSAINTLPPP